MHSICQSDITPDAGPASAAKADQAVLSAAPSHRAAHQPRACKTHQAGLRVNACLALQFEPLWLAAGVGRVGLGHIVAGCTFDLLKNSKSVWGDDQHSCRNPSAPATRLQAREQLDEVVVPVVE